MTQPAVSLKILLSLVNCTIDSNSEMIRIFEKAKSGLVFESFQMLDMECALALIIIASDAAHRGRGNVVFRPIYCKLLFYVLCDLSICYLSIFQHAICLFNLKESEWS